MATVTYSDLYDTTTLLPLAGRPIASPDGCDVDVVIHTIPTTELDTIDNFIHLCPVRTGKRLCLILLQSSAAGDTGTALDMDWTLRTTAADGTITDTQLVNNGTIFEAALTNQIWVLDEIQVGEANGSWGSIGLKVVAAATTPAEMAIRVAFFWR